MAAGSDPVQIAFICSFCLDIHSAKIGEQKMTVCLAVLGSATIKSRTSIPLQANVVACVRTKE